MKKTIILMVTVLVVILAAGIYYNNYLTAQFEPAAMTNPAYIVDHNAHHQ